MNHSDFTIGATFWCSGRQWRCTDLGTRVIVAIHIDRVEVGSNNPDLCRTLVGSEAEAEGWLNGPPYAVLESVFDEYDIEGCTLEPEADRPDISAELSDEQNWTTGVDKAKGLRTQAAAGGLRFDAYLPGSLAEWLLDLIERGVFDDPSEAVFVMLGEQRDLMEHPELRRDLLRRTLETAARGPVRPADEVFAELQEAMQKRSPPAVWKGRRE